MHGFQVPLAIKTAAVVETAIHHACNDGEIDLDFEGSSRRAPWKPFELYRHGDENYPCVSPTANAMYRMLCLRTPIEPELASSVNAISHLRYMSGEPPDSELEGELWALYDYIVDDGYHPEDVDESMISSCKDLRPLKLAVRTLNTVSGQSEYIVSLNVDQTPQEYAHAMSVVEKSAISALASAVDEDPTLIHAGWIFGFAYSLIESTGIGAPTLYRKAIQKSPLERIVRCVLQSTQ